MYKLMSEAMTEMAIVLSMNFNQFSVNLITNLSENIVVLLVAISVDSHYNLNRWCQVPKGPFQHRSTLGEGFNQMI